VKNAIERGQFLISFERQRTRRILQRDEWSGTILSRTIRHCDYLLWQQLSMQPFWQQVWPQAPLQQSLQ
jgi:hypothetical protein